MHTFIHTFWHVEITIKKLEYSGTKNVNIIHHGGRLESHSSRQVGAWVQKCTDVCVNIVRHPAPSAIAIFVNSKSTFFVPGAAAFSTTKHTNNTSTAFESISAAVILVKSTIICDHAQMPFANMTHGLGSWCFLHWPLRFPLESVKKYVLFRGHWQMSD